MDFGPLAELVQALEAQGLGVTIRPIREGSILGGFGSDDHYQFDGWEVGYISGMSGGELAVGRTIAEAVTEALRVEQDEADG